MEQLLRSEEVPAVTGDQGVEIPPELLYNVEHSVLYFPEIGCHILFGCIALKIFHTMPSPISEICSPYPTLLNRRSR